MASSEEDLKSLLVEVGSKLEKPPTSVKELLALLDRAEVYLSRVEQSPSKAIQNALSPTLKALIGDELLRHTDVDVKVSVASCISEITRITAPEVPYEDNQMKEVFQLIVSSFESLADMSNQSYSKRTSILETVSKVRSCVVMLDLECDGLILEMFRHFIKAIRDYHPENVYSSMESIMARVIEESEEISSDLLFCILDTLKKDNKEVMPIAQQLMKNVLETCANKVKPYIEIVMRTKGVSLADYDEVVSLICNEASAGTVVQSEHTDASLVNVQVDASKPVLSKADTVLPAEETHSVAVNPMKLPAGGCSEFVTSNGNDGVEADTLLGSSTLQDPKTCDADKASETVTAHPSAAVGNPDSPGDEVDTKASETITENPKIKDGDLDAEKADEGGSTKEPKTEKNLKRRGRKAKAKKKPSVPKLDGKSSGTLKQWDELAESHKSCSKDISASPKESPNEAAGPFLLKSSEAHDGPSKGIYGESDDKIYGESDDKLNGGPKSKTVISSLENYRLLEEEKTTISVGDFKEEATIPTVDTSKFKAIDSGVGASVDKTNALNDKQLENTTALANAGSHEVAAPTVDEPMEEVESSTGKSPEQVGVPSKDNHKVEEGLITKEGIKKRGRGKGKATLQKLAAQAAVDDNNKEATTSSQKSALKPVNDEEEMTETPKTSNKRKHIVVNSNESKDCGEELVGSKVKVWWPADKRFYKGVIESFDSAKKKHKVLYADGEVENLVLKKQRWEVIDPDEDSDTDEETHQETPASEKRYKPEDVNEGTSKKRLGRPPSSKSKSASHKPRRNPKDHAKAKTDNSVEEDKSKVERSKRFGRPRADGSKSTDRSTADEPSSNAAGKSKADEYKLTNKSTAEDAKSSGKLKGGDSKTSIKGKSDSNTAGKPEEDNLSFKRRDAKGKGTKSVDVTPVIKSAGKSKIKELSKSKSTPAAKEETLKVVSDANSEGISPKTAPKSGAKALAKADLDPSSSEGEEAAEEQTPSPAKAAGSLKRKAPLLEKGNKSGAKVGQKGMKGRKH